MHQYRGDEVNLWKCEVKSTWHANDLIKVFLLMYIIVFMNENLSGEVDFIPLMWRILRMHT